MKVNSPFKWLGNKKRLFKHYKSPSSGVKRIVEPFAGSMVYSLNNELPCLGLDNDSGLASIWRWLKTVSLNELKNLETTYNNFSKRVDLRKYDFPPHIRLFFSLGGALLPVPRNIIYPGMKRPNFLSLYEVLPKIQSNDFEFIEADCYDFYTPKKGDMMFIDPPYFGSGGLTSPKEAYNLHKLISLIDRCKVPTILTYGDNAPEYFPLYEWKHVSRETLAKPRVNSSKRTRTEWVSYINF